MELKHTAQCHNAHNPTPPSSRAKEAEKKRKEGSAEGGGEAEVSESLDREMGASCVKKVSSPCYPSLYIYPI